MDAFFKNEFTTSIKREWRDDPEIPKSYLLFNFWVEHMLSPNISVLNIPLKTLDINGCRLAQRYRVGSVIERMFWAEYGQIIF